MPRHRIAALVGAVVVFLSGSLLTGGALAAAPSCATGPTGYTGSDAVVGAVTQLDADVNANCQAETNRLETLDSDVKAGSSGNDTDLKAINGTLSGWTSSSPLPVALPAGGSGQAVQVTNWPSDQTVAFDSTASGQLDGEAQSGHNDLWILIGVIVGCFVCDVFLRKVWP